jgi:hypothetical protein
MLAMSVNLSQGIWLTGYLRHCHPGNACFAGNLLLVWISAVHVWMTCRGWARHVVIVRCH